MEACTVLRNGRVLIDGQLVDGTAVVIRGGRIEAVTPDEHVEPDGGALVDMGGGTLLPGFIDVQVNGGGGLLFNDDPSVDAIAAIGAAHQAFGTTGFLPTLISDELDAVEQALAAAQQAIDEGVPGVLGVHIEGPFISTARRGVHDPRRLRRLTLETAGRIQPLRGGRTVLTVAPEMVDPGTIELLCERGVLVCVGHTEATCEQTREALRRGVRGFTHLFNAMSQLTAREPGVVGAALDDDASWCGVIADGHHVAPEALRIAARAKRRDRLLLVTDAMPCVGSNAAGFDLQGRHVTVVDGVCRDETGTLAGTSLDMITAVRNAMSFMRLDLEAAAAMASTIPAAFLGIEHETGAIRPGCRADLAMLDEQLAVRQTWIGGRCRYVAAAEPG